MTREEIIAKFRQENPEVTERVLTDAQLHSWCLVGDKEICAQARLISAVTEWSAVADEEEYNLATRIASFYDVDEYPGGGVAYNDKRLNFKTVAELDRDSPGWRTESSGTPKDYYRQNQFLKLRPAPSGTSDITVYSIQVSDDFDDDDKLPFNQLTHLEPFHYAIVLYLTKRAKAKIGKSEEKTAAMNEYNDYVKWMRKELTRSTYGSIQFTPSTAYRGDNQYLR